MSNGSLIRERAKQAAPLVAIGLTTFVVRVLQRATSPTEWDSVLLLQGVDKFDVAQMDPLPPGYYLYVKLGWLLEHGFGMSTLDALSVAAAAASAGVAVVAFQIGRRLRSWTFGLVLTLIISTMPVAAYYGSIVETYSFDMLGALLLILIGTYAQTWRWSLPTAAVVVGIAGGFRPNAIVFDFPALLAIAWICRPASAKYISTNREWFRLVVVSAVAGLIAIALWAIPLFAEQPGGYKAWKSMSDHMFNGAMATTSWLQAPYSAASTNTGMAVAYIVIATIALWPAVIVGLAARIVSKVRLSNVEGSTLLICAATAIPSAVFCIFFHFGKAGYVLMYYPGTIIALTIAWSQLSKRWFVVVALLASFGIALQEQRYVGGDNILPKRLRNGDLWITQDRYWAPFPETIKAREHNSERIQQSIDALNTIGLTNKDIVITPSLNANERYAHITWAFPQPTVYFSGGDVAIYAAKNHQWTTLNPQQMRQINVPTGSRVFVAAAFPPDEVKVEQPKGQATPIFQSDIVSIWQIQPCTRIDDIFIRDLLSCPSYGNP